MPQNLFAACRTNGALVAKRIRLDQAVQQQIETIFNQQEADFRDGITSEVDFDGSWTPDDDEFLTIDVPQEAAGSYIIVAGTQILGESHGGIGRAWRNAAAAIRERELAKG